MPVLVRLNGKDLAWAREVAEGRADYAADRGLRSGYGASDRRGPTVERHLIGALGERALAAMLGVDWEPVVGELDTHVGDVAGWQARATRHDHGRLYLHPDRDAREDRYVLITGKPPWLTVQGWCYGHEGIRKRYYRRDLRYPCCLVPQEVLRHTREMLDA